MNWEEDSQVLDRHFGFRVLETERELLVRARAVLPAGDHHSWGSALHSGNQTWVGLHPDSIQTPYSELHRMCREAGIVSGDHVVDFGAGYGRLGVILEKSFPGSTFHGIEYVPERVAEGKRAFPSLHLTQGDLTAEDFFPEEADHYFIYDFGKVPHIRRLLNQLSGIADRKSFTLTGRGNGIRSLIAHEFHWLTPVYEEERFTIYRI